MKDEFCLDVEPLDAMGYISGIRALTAACNRSLTPDKRVGYQRVYHAVKSLGVITGFGESKNIFSTNHVKALLQFFSDNPLPPPKDLLAAHKETERKLNEGVRAEIAKQNKASKQAAIDAEKNRAKILKQSAEAKAAKPNFYGNR